MNLISRECTSATSEALVLRLLSDLQMHDGPLLDIVW